MMTTYDSPSITSCLHVTIEGRVQGVGFRYFVQMNAQELRLKGWVRNTIGGNVEVMAEGSRKPLETLLSLLRKGPEMAFVTAVHHTWKEPTNEYTRFSIIRTI
jgi:acylphosphatase